MSVVVIREAAAAESRRGWATQLPPDGVGNPLESRQVAAAVCDKILAQQDTLMAVLVILVICRFVAPQRLHGMRWR